LQRLQAVRLAVEALSQEDAVVVLVVLQTPMILFSL
jgi:hypothetical protein